MLIICEVDKQILKKSHYFWTGVYISRLKKLACFVYKSLNAQWPNMGYTISFINELPYGTHLPHDLKNYIDDKSFQNMIKSRNALLYRCGFCVLCKFLSCRHNFIIHMHVFCAIAVNVWPIYVSWTFHHHVHHYHQHVIIVIATSISFVHVSYSLLSHSVCQSVCELMLSVVLTWL